MDRKKIIRYTSIKFSFLESFCAKVHNGELAPGVHLAVATNDSTGVRGYPYKKGETVRVVKNNDVEGTFEGSVPWETRSHIFAWSSFERKDRTKWTTEDVAQYVIKAACLSKECIYLEFMDKSVVARFEYQGSFVSQARGCSFEHLVGALKHYYKLHERDASKEYVWLDIFCVNQPVLSKEAQTLKEKRRRRKYEAYLTEGLHRAIANFDNVVLFLKDWKNPKPLKRAWCVWEVFGLVLANKKLEVAVTEDEYKEIVEYYEADDYENTYQRTGAVFRIQDVLSQGIRLQTAECFSKADLRMIHEAIKAQSSFLAVHVAVASKMKHFFRETGKAVQRKHLERPVPTLETIQLLDRLFVKLDNAAGTEALRQDQENYDFAVQMLEVAKRCECGEYESHGGTKIRNSTGKANWLQKWCMYVSKHRLMQAAGRLGRKSEMSQLLVELKDEGTWLFNSFQLDEKKDSTDQLAQITLALTTFKGRITDKPYLSMIMKKLQIAIVSGDSDAISDSMLDLNRLHLFKKEFDRCREMIEEALNSCKSGKYGFGSRNRGTWLMALIDLWEREDATGHSKFKARDDYLKARYDTSVRILDLSRELRGSGSFTHIANLEMAAREALKCASELSLIADRQPYFANAVDYAGQAHRFLNEQDPTSPRIASGLIFLAQVYMKQGFHQKSRDCLKKALVIAELYGEQAFVYQECMRKLNEE